MHRAKQVALTCCTFVIVSFCGCSQPSKGGDSRFFAPRDWESERSEAGDVAIKEGDAATGSADVAGEEFPWAPDEHPVRFHMLEESERLPATTRATVREFQENIRDCSLNCDEIAWSLAIGAYLPFDSQLADIGPDAFTERGAFFGLGEPFIDTHLHMFECGGAASDAIYVTDDYFVECRGDAGLLVYFHTDPDAPGAHPPEPPQVSEPWRSWWEEIYERGRQALSREANPFEHYLGLAFFVYSANQRTGAGTTRLLRVIAECIGRCDPGDERWYPPNTVVPPKYCMTLEEARGKCLNAPL